MGRISGGAPSGPRYVKSPTDLSRIESSILAVAYPLAVVYSIPTDDIQSTLNNGPRWTLWRFLHLQPATLNHEILLLFLSIRRMKSGLELNSFWLFDHYF